MIEQLIDSRIHTVTTNRVGILISRNDKALSDGEVGSHVSTRALRKIISPHANLVVVPSTVAIFRTVKNRWRGMAH